MPARVFCTCIKKGTLLILNFSHWRSRRESYLNVPNTRDMEDRKTSQRSYNVFATFFRQMTFLDALCYLHIAPLSITAIIYDSNSMIINGRWIHYSNDICLSLDLRNIIVLFLRKF